MKKLAKGLVLSFIIGGLFACNSKTAKQRPNPDTPVTGVDTFSNQNLPKQDTLKAKPEPTQHATMQFVDYNDDSDYYQFIAQQGDNVYYFINSDDTDRSLNRGDLIDITWKHGMITIAGDDEKPEPAEMLVSVKKTSDGPVSKFRKEYNKQLKYTWSADEQYSKDYLDKIYKLAEYYLANTKNELLKNAINKRSDITYSIEQAERENRNYTLLGIAPVGENGANVAEWLYIDTETHRLYLFDQAEDTLRMFK
ncbi:hypothetical protein [Mucilaginibacter conchicola]|nr:hypothetical protein [Mucilaginibacter conchicola]